MRKIYLVLISAILFAGACSNFTEITPKGRNILNQVEDLDMLLNNEYSISLYNLRTLTSDVYPQMNIPDLLNESPKTLTGIYMTWDETTDRVALTTSDNVYNQLYEIIGQIANPVLLNINAAEGDQTLAKQLKAEALVLRGWCHYLLVNAYTKAYDPETAETDPGIVYRMETDAIEVPNEKLTVAEIYERILADVDSAINLGSLPITPNKMRVGLPFAYAVKAEVLMSMHDYDGAFDAAEESLTLKSAIDNYNDFVAVETEYGSNLLEFTRPELALEEELFDTPVMFYREAFTPEMWDAFEDGHVLKEYLLTDVRVYGSASEGTLIYGLDTPVTMSYGSLYYSPLGLTTVNMYLIQAECHIREGNVTDAMELLNEIRRHRITADMYKDKTATSPEEAFEILKKISRTENFATMKNFINLKRWNTEAAYQETLRKTIEYNVNIYDNGGNIVGTEPHSYSYELSPDSPLWIFPFPQGVTNYNPNLTQNYN